jgi:hypothetical protein
MADSIAGSIVVLIVVLLVLAIAHKLNVVRTGSHRGEPLLAISPWRLRHGPALLLAATVLEASVVVALFADTPLGLGLVVCLSLMYAALLRDLGPDEGCRCFGNLMHVKTRRLAIMRNVLLAAVSASALGLSLADAVAPRATSDLALGTVAIAVAVLVALILVKHVALDEVPTTDERMAR